MLKPTVILLTAFTLAACGGGGSGSNSPNEPTPPTTEQPKSGDNKDPIIDEPEVPEVNPYILESLVIKDPKNYRPFTDATTAACSDPVLQFAIPVDINGDKYDDFILHYWCGNPTTPEEFRSPTPDRVLAQISNSEGEYTVATSEVFGAEYVQMGGMSRKYRAGDINGDGHEDFAFAMNWEDGRPDIQGENNVGAQPAMLLSAPKENGLVQYRVKRIGERSWGHGVAIVKHDDGTRDVAFSGYTNISKQVFRYTPDGFEDVSADYAGTYDWTTHAEMLDTDGVTEFVAANIGINGASGVVLLDKNGDTFTNVGTYEQKVEFNVNFNGYQAPVVNVNGRLGIGGAFYTMCKMPKFSEDVGNVLVANLSTTRLVNGDDPVANGNYTMAGETETVNYLLFFEYDETGLRQIDNPLVGENTDVNYNFIYCEDVNNDGLTDVVTSPFSRGYNYSRMEQDGRPDVYLNNGNGKLELQDLSYLPGYPGDATMMSTRGKLEDVNNDGIKDLMLFGDNTANGAGDIQIHLLKDVIQ